jgi:hypothetical protein
MYTKCTVIHLLNSKAIDGATASALHLMHTGTGPRKGV